MAACLFSPHSTAETQLITRLTQQTQTIETFVLSSRSSHHDGYQNREAMLKIIVSSVVDEGREIVPRLLREVPNAHSPRAWGVSCKPAHPAARSLLYALMCFCAVAYWQSNETTVCVRMFPAAHPMLQGNDRQQVTNKCGSNINRKAKKKYV